MSPPDPTQLGEFTILEKIGQGAMGAVYKAQQRSLGRIVALKLLPAHYAGDADFVARFKREASAAAALNHPNIVQIYAAGEEGGAHYFAMEYVEGESLGARLERKGRIEAREALAVAHYVAQALDYAWKKAGVVHRDIKPDNIFLSREGTVKLGDLGLAKVLAADGAGLTQTGTTMGTPYYVSPEQAVGNKEIDFRADIYSLGCTLFHVISGQTPYRGESAMSVMLQHITQPAPKIQTAWPGSSPPLIGLLDRMLRKKPEERHESYEALLQQLLWAAERLKEPSASAAAAMSMVVPMPAADGAPAKSKPPAKKAVAVPPAKGKAGIFVTAVAALAAIAVGLLAWQPWKKPLSMADTAPPVTPVPAPVTPPAATSAAAKSMAAQPTPATPAAITPAPLPKETPAAIVQMPAPSSPAPSAPAPVLSHGPEAEGFVSLFDSDHLADWKEMGDGGFTVQDGVATSWVAKREGCWWYEREPYGDFVLKMEFRIATPNANSGVYVRCPRPEGNGMAAQQAGYQIDVSEEPNPFEMTGAICGIKPPASVPQSKRDWNQLEINLVGQHYLVKVNGILVNDFTGNKRTSGYIGLQEYKVGGVQFRNVRIKELNSTIAGAATPAPGQSDPAARRNSVVNLLPEIDLPADTVAGTFTPTAAGMVTSQAGLCKLELPYRPPAEYNFSMTFTCGSGIGELNQMLSRGGRAFEWCIGANGTVFGFQTILGKNAGINPTVNHIRLEKNRKYTSLVEVRNEGLKGYLDGALVSQWKTNYSDMGVWTHWKLPDDTRLGVGTLNTSATIHSIEVLEVSGRGTLLRPAKAAAAVPVSTGVPTKLDPTGNIVDREGFSSLFNGRDLTGWNGDPRYWSVREGAITADSQSTGRVQSNTFLIWTGTMPGDFELRLSFKVTSGNSGVQYRSKIFDRAIWKVFGYQYEIDADKRGTNGALYEEGGHRPALGNNPGGLMLANVGERVRMTPDNRRDVIGSVGGAASFRAGNWNDLVIVAKGNHLVHLLNGVTTIELTDEDEKAQSPAGLLALQLHAGTAQKVQFKDVRVKKVSQP